MLKYKLCWKNRPLRELFIYHAPSIKPAKFYQSITYTALISISRKDLCERHPCFFLDPLA